MALRMMRSRPDVCLLSSPRNKVFQFQKPLTRRYKSSKAPPPPTTTTPATIGVATTSGSKPLATRLWVSYTSALETNPVRTKMTVAALIFFSSDSATQYIMDSEEPWDASRACSGAVFGVVATGYLHVWWGFLERTIGSLVQSRIANTAAKVVIDQGVGAPLYIFTYYIITNFLQKISAEKESLTFAKAKNMLIETEERARQMLWPTMMRHWKVWPFVHSVNFYYVPLHHRVLVQNAVLVGWSGYLSYLNKTGLGLPENNGKLITPTEEIETTIKRKATVKSVP